MKKLTLKDHKIAALKYARKAIVNDERTFICFALCDYAEDKNNHLADEAVEYLTDYISESLGSHNTLSRWVDARVKAINVCGTSKMKRTRLAYIDWMIACYEGKV